MQFDQPVPAKELKLSTLLVCTTVLAICALLYGYLALESRFLDLQTRDSLWRFASIFGLCAEALLLKTIGHKIRVPVLNFAAGILAIFHHYLLAAACVGLLAVGFVFVVSVAAKHGRSLQQ